MFFDVSNVDAYEPSEYQVLPAGRHAMTIVKADDSSDEQCPSAVTIIYRVDTGVYTNLTLRERLILVGKENYQGQNNTDQRKLKAICICSGKTSIKAFEDLVGCSLVLDVIHKPSKNGGVYANVKRYLSRKDAAAEKASQPQPAVNQSSKMGWL
jgi:hypothetical protein